MRPSRQKRDGDWKVIPNPFWNPFGMILFLGRRSFPIVAFLRDFGTRVDSLLVCRIDLTIAELSNLKNGKIVIVS